MNSKQLLKDYGISQEEIAEELDKSRQTINDWIQKDKFSTEIAAAAKRVIYKRLLKLNSITGSVTQVSGDGSTLIGNVGRDNILTVAEQLKDKDKIIRLLERENQELREQLEGKEGG